MKNFKTVQKGRGYIKLSHTHCPTSTTTNILPPPESVPQVTSDSKWDREEVYAGMAPTGMGGWRKSAGPVQHFRAGILAGSQQCS